MKYSERVLENIDMPLTELILTENIPGLGAEADVVKVRRGYARNYLLPHGKAHEVTPGTLRQLDALKQKRAAPSACRRAGGGIFLHSQGEGP